MKPTLESSFPTGTNGYYNGIHVHSTEWNLGDQRGTLHDHRPIRRRELAWSRDDRNPIKATDGGTFTQLAH